MSEPTIIVIPEAYYGGAVPKKISKAEVASGGITPRSPKTARNISPKLVFFVIVGVLFLGVVGGAIWYFTRGLATPAPETTLSPTPTIPEPTSVPVQPPPTAPTAEAPTSPEAPPLAPAELTPASDADADFLTEAEESLYGSQAMIPDTDSDGFLDGHEVFNLYNPSGLAPERLEATGFVTRFAHPTYAYELLYPKTWQLLPEATAREISFQSATRESIAVSILDNPEQVTARAFAETNAPQGTITDWTANKANIAGVLVEEAIQLRGIFGVGDFLYVVHYALPAQGTPAYRKTFEMMLNSFKIQE